jgi:hypothetical protein
MSAPDTGVFFVPEQRKAGAERGQDIIRGQTLPYRKGEVRWT